MRVFSHKIVTRTFLLCFLHFTVIAQTEYLVNVDESSGSYKSLSSIPDVMFVIVAPNCTTFDEKNERYIFVGSPDNVTWSLYSLDAKSGQIITKAPYAAFANGSNLIELQFGNSTNMLYGLHWDNTANLEYLVTIDLATGAYHSICSLSEVTGVNSHSTAFDDDHNLFMFIGSDTNGNLNLYSVSVLTGVIVTKSNVGNLSCIQYDNTGNNLYGLYNESGNWYFVLVNSMTGTIIKLSALTDVQGIISEGATLDEKKHQFKFVANDLTSAAFLYTIDALTGNIKYKVPANLTNNANEDNVISYRYDNVNDKLCALHWEAHTVIPIPFTFTLGNDTTLCSGQTLHYNFNIDSGLYHWNTGSTSNEYTITSPGDYSLTITKGAYSMTDTIVVQYRPSPIVSLGNDTSICENSILQLSAKNNNSTYQWQDNSTDSMYTVHKSGTYFVVVNSEGCTTSDTISISYKTIPHFSLGNDTFLCKGQTLLLHPFVSNARSYRWQDGSSLQEYFVSDTGTYRVQVSNECGATSDTVKVSRGPCELIMPTSFTPNHDGLNDLFRVKYANSVKQFHMTIYNRWGEKIFETRISTDGWDGTYKGIAQLSGTYVWVIDFVDVNDVKRRAQGSVTLLR